MKIAQVHPATRTTYLASYADIDIEVVAEGQGALIVMLPSLGRDSDDFDAVAELLAGGGYRVLRPAPRGIGRSSGPSTGLTLHSFARDIAEIIQQDGSGPAVIFGHAYGNWIARTVASDFPNLVRGVVIAAAASKSFDPLLRGYIDKCEDQSLTNEERLKYLRMAFFAHSSNPMPWLEGWHGGVKESQRQARAATPLEEFWAAGIAPMLDLIAGNDPFRLPQTYNENKQEFGQRVSTVLIPNASHALIPEQPEAVAQAVTQWIGSCLKEPRLLSHISSENEEIKTEDGM